MRTAVLGATGPTGKEVVKEALERGHDVIALVRNPDGLSGLKNDKLQVHKVDIFQENDLSPHFQGCDYVMSCLGCQASFLGWTPITFYEDSIKPITFAMRTANIKRLVCITSIGTIPTEGESKVLKYFLRPFFLRSLLTSMATMETYLQRECQDLDFTAVRPPELVNSPSSGVGIQPDREEEGPKLYGKTIVAVEGQYVPNGNGKISRRDVAKFMLDTAGVSDWSRKCVAIETL